MGARWVWWPRMHVCASWAMDCLHLFTCRSHVSAPKSALLRSQLTAHDLINTFLCLTVLLFIYPRNWPNLDTATGERECISLIGPLRLQRDLVRHIHLFQFPFSHPSIQNNPLLYALTLSLLPFFSPTLIKEYYPVLRGQTGQHCAGSYFRFTGMWFQRCLWLKAGSSSVVLQVFESQQ